MEIKAFIKNESYDNHDNDNDDIKEDLKDIKKIKKELGKDIIYYNDIKKFELEVNKNQKSVGYVVAKYSMGYDNKNIDIIYLIEVQARGSKGLLSFLNSK